MLSYLLGDSVDDGDVRVRYAVVLIHISLICKQVELTLTCILHVDSIIPEAGRALRSCQGLAIVVLSDGLHNLEGVGVDQVDSLHMVTSLASFHVVAEDLKGSFQEVLQPPGSPTG